MEHGSERGIRSAKESPSSKVGPFENDKLEAKCECSNANKGRGDTREGIAKLVRARARARELASRGARDFDSLLPDAEDPKESKSHPRITAEYNNDCNFVLHSLVSRQELIAASRRPSRQWLTALRVRVIIQIEIP